MIQLSKHGILVNVFGAIGYLLLLFAWVLLASEMILLLIVPNLAMTPLATVQASYMLQQTLSLDFFIGLEYIFTTVTVLSTVVIFIVLFRLISKGSSQILQWFLRLIKVLPTRRHVFLVKACITTTPLLGFLFYATALQPTDMTFSAVYITAVIITIITLMSFSIQLLLARSLHIAVKDIW